MTWKTYWRPSVSLCCAACWTQLEFYIYMWCRVTALLIIHTQSTRWSMECQTKSCSYSITSPLNLIAFWDELSYCRLHINFIAKSYISLSYIFLKTNQKRECEIKMKQRLKIGQVSSKILCWGWFSILDFFVYCFWNCEWNTRIFLLLFFNICMQYDIVLWSPCKQRQYPTPHRESNLGTLVSFIICTFWWLFCVSYSFLAI